MKKNLLLSFAAFLISGIISAQAFCNASGNVIIYSNYDGGPLTINCDQNIPNMKIGIVSYEFARITITGPYAGNVTEVRWAGYNGTNNHCSLSTPYTTSITGVPNNVDTIIMIPPASYANANGYNFIICNYSCDNTTNQGGCNTPDQIVDYFMSAFGGTLYYHHTQYGCWTNTMNVSTGGNCCIVPSTLSIAENSNSSFEISPNPSSGKFLLHTARYPANAYEIKILNALGQTVLERSAVNAEEEIDLSAFENGVYMVNVKTQDGNSNTRKIVLQR
jgi:hypothetical protein